MLTVLGGLAEFERSPIKARCDTRFARARAAGVKFGRKPKLFPYSAPEGYRAGRAARRRAPLRARMASIRRPYLDFELENPRRLDKLVARPLPVTFPVREVAFSPHRRTRRVAQTHRRTSYRP
jgi:hypothetical protein